MDAVVQEKVMTEEDKHDHERKARMKKLSDQYRGKFPRIDGIGNVKDKAVAVLHFSAGNNNGTAQYCLLTAIITRAGIQHGNNRRTRRRG